MGYKQADMDTARYVEKITVLFGRILAGTELDPETVKMGLTASQLQGLSYLFHHGSSSIGEIAEGLGTSHPASVKLVDRLEKKGFVERNPSASDRRVSVVELTELGRELVEKTIAQRTEILAKAMERMDEPELEGLMRGLESLLSGVLGDRTTVDSICLKCGDDHIGCCIVNRTHLEMTGNTMENT